MSCYFYQPLTSSVCVVPELSCDDGADDLSQGAEPTVVDTYSAEGV